jgi:hypothetical protein
MKEAVVSRYGMVPLMGFLGPKANAGQNRAGRQL